MSVELDRAVHVDFDHAARLDVARDVAHQPASRNIAHETKTLAPLDAKLSDLDLAALLCSRVCHDVISPVGAIANGLELIDDPEMDEETKETALAMVRSSAKTAAAKLKFCRIAFGAAGSAGALIDMGEAGEIAKAFVGDEKVKLEWNAPRENRPKQQVKLVLNMMLMAMAGIPRGGLVTVIVKGDVGSVKAAVEAGATMVFIDGMTDKELGRKILGDYDLALMPQACAEVGRRARAAGPPAGARPRPCACRRGACRRGRWPAGAVRRRAVAARQLHQGA